MCKKAVKIGLYNLKFVPDLFVTQEQIKIWHDHNHYCYDDKIVEWYEGHQKCKAQKAKIKDELMPTAWHPSRWWDWCIPEEEKKETEKLWQAA